MSEKKLDPRRKRYYWLKLEKNFFKRHDIKVIESLDNGKDYLLFYMKLLLESIAHEGELRFNETIPYNEKMLSTITDTNIDIVRSAIKVFTELHLMEIWDDSTIYMKEIEKMVGSETIFAREQRRVRANKKSQSRQIETMSHNNSISISNSNSKSNSNKEDETTDNKTKTKVKNKHGEFKNVLLTDDELEKLKVRNPNYQKYIEDLSLYKESSGKKYKSDYATVLNWIKKDTPAATTPESKVDYVPRRDR